MSFTPPAWQERGACNDHPADVFFPKRGESTKPAKVVCATCPVRRECLDFAIDEGITHGVWGGLSELERRSIRRTTRRRAT